MKVQFKTKDYTIDDKFEDASYEFEGNEEEGWKIKRNKKLYLELGKGYELLETKYCGVCSTDLARRFLPFPLPQVTGHEVLAKRKDSNNYVVVEINDTPEARGDELDSFGKVGLSHHSPERKVLGIDRLPGGFSPYILAPKNAIHSAEGIPEFTAVLTEPFAAALQAVYSSPPAKGTRVAVLGPKKLGLMLIAALAHYRRTTKIIFTIAAIGRHENLLKEAINLGADAFFLTDNPVLSKTKFETVYDTTGNPEGFLLALKLAKNEVHLKSTNGQVMAGLKKMTELVVDEMSLLGYSEENLNFKWQSENRTNQNILISPSVQELDKKNNYIYFAFTKEEAENYLKTANFQVPRFDIGIAGNLEEIDWMIRPNSTHENSLIRPKGGILYKGNSSGPLEEFLINGGKIRTSRCGEFSEALKAMREDHELSHSISHVITHKIESKKIQEAFEIAKSPEAIKVVIEHKEK